MVFNISAALNLLRAAVLVSLLVLPAGKAITAEARQCTNAGCHRHALGDTWLFCPYCGTKLPAPSLTKPSQQEVIVGNVYKNAEFGFQVEAPSEKWKILTGKEVADKLNSDALVGMVSDEGVYSMVIVEKMPGVSTDKYMQMVAPSLEDRQRIYQETFEFPGGDGLRSKWSGTTSDLPFHFYYKVVAYGDNRLQVVSWLVAGNDNESHQAEIRAIEDSLQLLQD